MKDEVSRAIKVLKEGGVILYPTDTVWGLGCDATNPAAVEKIYRIKQSTNKHSMLVLVYPLENIARYIKQVPEIAWELYRLSDAPLTLILPGATGIATNLIPDEGTLGIRVPDHQFCQALLGGFGRAIVSTSANISKNETPLTLDQVEQEVISEVDLVVDPRFDCGAIGKPSTIISVGSGGQIKIIRE